MFPIIEKLVNWFTMQINRLVYILWETLIVHGLRCRSIPGAISHDTSKALAGFDMLVLITNSSLVERQFGFWSYIVSLKNKCLKSLCKNILLMVVLVKAQLLIQSFSYLILMTFLMILSVILLSILMILFSFLCGSGYWLVTTFRVALWTWIWLTSHCGLREELAWWFCCINMFHLMWKWICLFLTKNS